MSQLKYTMGDFRYFYSIKSLMVQIIMSKVQTQAQNHPLLPSIQTHPDDRINIHAWHVALVEDRCTCAPGSLVFLSNFFIEFDFSAWYSAPSFVNTLCTGLVTDRCHCGLRRARFYGASVRMTRNFLTGFLEEFLPRQRSKSKIEMMRG